MSAEFSEYSPLKAFHHRDRLDMLHYGGIPGPVHVQVVPTNRCNQNCAFCAYRAKGYSSSAAFDTRDEIPTERLLRLAAELQRLGVRAVEITGGGEPTVHPAFAEFCGALLSEGIEYGVVTNGVNAWKQATFEALRAATWVRFSLDAADPATYAAIRRSAPATLAAVRESVAALVSQRDGRDPVVGVGFVVTADNWREVLDAARHAKQDGADNIRISAVFQNEGSAYFSEFKTEASELCRRAKRELETNTFRVFDLFSNRLDDLDIGPPKHPRCLFQHLCTYIGADQCVYRCCVVAYNSLGYLGSIAETPFDALWRSESLQDSLRTYDARRCPRCMYTNKNATLRYAISDTPRHVNFL